MSNKRYYLAIDIGASSGRHVLGSVVDGKIELEEIHRFDNVQIRKRGHDCWDVDMLMENILVGLEKCKEAGKLPETVGIDTWGVDFVLIDKDGNLVGDAVAYRDSRTQAHLQDVDTKIGLANLYRTCGIQRQPFNTIYQFAALNAEHPEELEAASRFLMIPEYFNFKLCGKAVNEYTNATTTCMLNARTCDWDVGVLRAVGAPARLFEKPQMPGIVLGAFTPEVEERVGFSANVILPATHDTGSAFLAVPARDASAVYLSSGTWSLLGVEHEGPITSDASRFQNFTNEGGFQKRYRFLKNIMGLWMIQSIRRELNGKSYVEGKSAANLSNSEAQNEGEQAYGLHTLSDANHGSGKQWGFGDLIEAARKAGSATNEPAAKVNVNDDRFLAPESMIAEIQRTCEETGQAIPKTVGAIMRCVYESLASCYVDSIAELKSLTGRKYTSINIVGGGCQDAYLNQLTANACKLPVYAGPIEGTSLGNLCVQMLTAGEFTGLSEARDAIRNSFDVSIFEPEV